MSPFRVRPSGSGPGPRGSFEGALDAARRPPVGDQGLGGGAEEEAAQYESERAGAGERQDGGEDEGAQEVAEGPLEGPVPGQVALAWQREAAVTIAQ